MAERLPLVLVNGQIQQLQAGDLLPSDAITELEAVTMLATSNLVIGNAVYVDGNDSVDLAQADAIGTADVLGLCVDTTVNSAANGVIATAGAVLTANTTQWDAVAGTTGGLTAGAPYFLSKDTAGLLTETAPTATGEVVIIVGKGLSTLKMKIDPQHTILL